MSNNNDDNTLKEVKKVLAGSSEGRDTLEYELEEMGDEVNYNNNTFEELKKEIAESVKCMDRLEHQLVEMGDKINYNDDKKLKEMKKEVATSSKSMDTLESRIVHMSNRMGRSMMEVKKMHEQCDKTNKQLLNFIDVLAENMEHPDAEELKKFLLNENASLE